PSELIALVLRHRDIVLLVEEGLLDEAPRLKVDKGGTVEAVAPSLCDGRQNGRRRLAHLCAEILGLELVFLNSNLREGIADTEVLPEHAAVVDRVLEAHSIEQ